MKRSTRRLTIFLILFLTVFSLPPMARGQLVETAIIYGCVTDADTKNPLPNATVLIWNVKIMQIAANVKTNVSGQYQANLTADPYGEYYLYRLFCYNDLEDTLGIDYVPSKTDNVKLNFGEKRCINFTLVPGALLNLQNEIYYVKSKGVGRFSGAKAVDYRTQSAPEIFTQYNCVDNYGFTEDAWLLSPLGINSSMVIIPAETSVDVVVESYTRVGIDFIFVSFVVNNDGAHYTMQKGGAQNVDLRYYSLQTSIQVLQGAINSVWDNLRQAETMGFYVSSQKRKISASQELMYSAEWDVKAGRYDECWLKLRQAYVTSQDIILRELTYMYSVAAFASLFLPLFASLYAAAIAIFLFEEEKRKIAASCISYVLILIAIYALFPGFRLINFVVFLETVAVSGAITFFILFVLPRWIKEPEIEHLRVAFRSAIAITFSMAKRHMKRRRLRSILTIVSIAILITSFTAFTSFSRIYSEVSEVVAYTPPHDGVLIKDMPETAQDRFRFFPLDPFDVNWLMRQGIEESFIAPKAENLPREGPLGVMVHGSNEQEIYGVVGITFDSEGAFTDFDLLVQDPLLTDYFVFISETAAETLQVHKGDVVQIAAYIAGGREFYQHHLVGGVANFTVGGVISDFQLNEFKDFNGETFVPYYLKREEAGYKVAPCNSSNVIIMPWSLAVKFPPIDFKSGYSQSVVTSRIIFSMGDYDETMSLIKTIVLTRNYYVWFSHDKKMTLYHLGYRFEVVGALPILIPLLIVVANVATTMMSVVHERRNEIAILSRIGLTPSHVALLFLAESIIAGLLAGGSGYLLGLLAYRFLSIFGVGIVVQEKLEWFWPFIGVSLAVVVAVLSAVRPALRAAVMSAPSMIKRVRLPGIEKRAREDVIFKAFAPNTYLMPLRVHVKEAPFFFAYILDRLSELRSGATEIVEKLREENEELKPEGQYVKRIHFAYKYVGRDRALSTTNEIVIQRKRDADYYSVHLICKPDVAGMPERFRERTVTVIRDMMMDWLRRRK